MKIDTKTKKEVAKEWLNAFPHLSTFNLNKLYKVVGPCLMGIELIKSPFTVNYSPHFVMYPLWKRDLLTSLEYPILLMDFKNEKGFQCDIPYEKHSASFSDVMLKLKEQMPLSLDRNVSLDELVTVIIKHSQTPPLSAAPNSFLQAILQESILKIALFVSTSEAQSVLEQMNKRRWDTNHFRSCGEEVNRWLQSLEATISSRDEFLKQIATNKQDKKISILASSELTR